MSQNEIHDILAQLRAEVADDTSPEAKPRLLRLIADLEGHLEAEESGSESPFSFDHLRQLAEDFEVEHPRITSLVHRISVTLSNMGV